LKKTVDVQQILEHTDIGTRGTIEECR
jgi:hypothetical protein